MCMRLMSDQARGLIEGGVLDAHLLDSRLQKYHRSVSLLLVIKVHDLAYCSLVVKWHCLYTALYLQECYCVASRHTIYISGIDMVMFPAVDGNLYLAGN